MRVVFARGNENILLFVIGEGRRNRTLLIFHHKFKTELGVGASVTERGEVPTTPIIEEVIIGME